MSNIDFLTATYMSGTVILDHVLNGVCVMQMKYGERVVEVVATTSLDAANCEQLLRGLQRGITDHGLCEEFGISNGSLINVIHTLYKEVCPDGNLTTYRAKRHFLVTSVFLEDGESGSQVEQMEMVSSTMDTYSVDLAKILRVYRELCGAKRSLAQLIGQGVIKREDIAKRLNRTIGSVNASISELFVRSFNFAKSTHYLSRCACIRYVYHQDRGEYEQAQKILCEFNIIDCSTAVPLNIEKHNQIRLDTVPPTLVDLQSGDGVDVVNEKSDSGELGTTSVDQISPDTSPEVTGLDVSQETYEIGTQVTFANPDTIENAMFIMARGASVGPHIMSARSDDFMLESTVVYPTHQGNISPRVCLVFVKRRQS